MDQLTKTTIETMDSPPSKKILILGGGFGGVKAALELAGRYNFEVTLISDQPNFRYYPMLYRSATGGSHVMSSIPLPEIFSDTKLNIVHDQAVSLDRAKKTVRCQSGKTYEFDVLIVGLGSVTNYFGVKGLKEYSFGIKSIEEANELRNHLHQQLLDEGRPDINYVVIGGGPTGVELAGALPGYIKRIMKRHGLAERQVNVTIVEAKKRILPNMSAKFARRVSKRLSRLGVILLTDQRVLAETADSLTLSGRGLTSETVVWTAGVTTNPFLAANNFKLGEHGKVAVDEYLQAEPDIFVIGDNADTEYSGMAQTALHDGLYVAKYLKSRAAGRKKEPYMPRRPVYVIPVGSRWAAVAWGKRQVFGRLGWVLRRLADWVGYHDLQPWWKASRRWMAENDSEEICPLCDNK